MSVDVTEYVVERRAELRAKEGFKKGAGGQQQHFAGAGRYGYAFIDDNGVADFNLIGATWRDPHKLAAAKAAFDALPDDAVVTLYHSTTAERAAGIVATGRVEVPAGYQSELHSMAPQSMYVAPTVADAARYGEAVVTFKVRKGDLVPSPETLAVATHDPTTGSSTLARSLFGSFDGAVLNPGQQLGRVNIVGAKPAPKVDLARELVDNEGFTLNPRTGTLVRHGVAVAIQGHTGIMSAKDFMDGDKGRAFVRDYVHKMAAAKPSADTMVGGWYDREHDEIDLDWVEVFKNREAGIAAGRERNQMAVYDLGNNEEIPTGGTGDREAILAGAEARAAGRHEAIQAVGRDDHRRVGPLRRPGVGGDDGQPRKAQVVARLAELEWRKHKPGRKSGEKKGGGGHLQTFGEHGRWVKAGAQTVKDWAGKPATKVPSTEPPKVKTMPAGGDFLSGSGSDVSHDKKHKGNKPKPDSMSDALAILGFTGQLSPWDLALARSPAFEKALTTHYDSPDAPRLAAELANTIVGSARKVEPKITSDITAVAGKAGAEMFGLEFRIKENTGRISDKILQVSAEDGVTLADAAGKLSDPVRYTFHVDPANYVSSFRTVQTELESRGYTLRVKNYWPPGDAYNGVNVALTSPTGVPVEVQFHTPVSQRIKDKVHVQYEEYRKPTTPQQRRIELWRQMVSISDNQTFPPEWQAIPNAQLQPPPAGFVPAAAAS